MFRVVAREAVRCSVVRSYGGNDLMDVMFEIHPFCELTCDLYIKGDTSYKLIIFPGELITRKRYGFHNFNPLC